jgi:tRNA (guanosine-2'-O-)-methyltransferase
MLRGPMRRSDPDVVPFTERPLPPAPAPDAEVVEALRPFVSDARAARIEEVLATRTRRLVVILDHVHDPHNGGAIVRSCDAFGVQDVFCVERDEMFALARRATRRADKWVDVHRFDSPAACLEAARARGLQIFVAAPEGRETLGDLRDRVAQGGRVGLCFGNEHEGVDDRLREAADGTFHVPMVGFVESLNVSVAVGVSLHGIRSGLPGDLSEDERLRLRARFYRLTVREADAIVRRGLRP